MEQELHECQICHAELLSEGMLLRHNKKYHDPVCDCQLLIHYKCPNWKSSPECATCLSRARLWKTIFATREASSAYQTGPSGSTGKITIKQIYSHLTNAFFLQRIRFTCIANGCRRSYAVANALYRHIERSHGAFAASM